MNTLEHELLVRIDERVQQLQRDVTNICSMNATQNGRISKLENWQSKIIGALLLLSASIPILIVFV